MRIIIPAETQDWESRRTRITRGGNHQLPV